MGSRIQILIRRYAFLPGVHPTVDDRVMHGIGHC